MVQPRVVIVTLPAQGHINPALQFAKRLIGMGVEVTILTSLSAHRRIAANSAAAVDGLTFESFSDGYDDGFKRGIDDANHFKTQFRSRGSHALRQIIAAGIDQGRPITGLVYTLILPFVAKVAREHHVPSALLWIQPATVFDIYYFYFNGYGDAIGENGNNNDSLWSVKLPKLPPLAKRDLPSFLLPSSAEAYPTALTSFKEHFETLKEEINPTVLVNTFDSLEAEALTAIDNLRLIAIGPLVPSASDDSSIGDLFQKSGDEDYLQWLDSNPESSVVYVSFGSIYELTQKQTEEIGRGLLKSGRPFLWVIREKSENREDKLNIKAGKLEEGKGMIVKWCSQLEVLSHPSIGCFVTHCGWNSVLESLVSGVPMVAFPQWTDQTTNAKLIEDVWRSGVRVMADEEGMVDGDEVERCIEAVMSDGEKGMEMRKNAKKWKELGMEAGKEGGISCNNLKAFVDQIVMLQRAQSV